MNEVWLTLIGVTGALLGSLVGSMTTARASRQAQRDAHMRENEKERREAFCQALNALLNYRMLEIKRAEEARRRALSVDDVASAGAAREARATCRYHWVVLRVLMADDTAQSYADLLEKVHSVSRADNLALADEVKRDIEGLASSYGEAVGRRSW